MKRLTIITDFLPPLNPAESRRLITFIRAALKNDWRVTVLVSKDSNSGARSGFDPWQIFADEASTVKIRTIWGGVRLSKLRKLEPLLLRYKGGKALYNTLVFIDRASFWFWILTVSAHWVLLKFRPNVLLTASFPYSGHLPGLVLSRMWGISWVVDTRNGWALDNSEELAKIKPTDESKTWYDGRIRTALNHAAQVWTVSDRTSKATARAFKRQHRDKFVPVIQGYEHGVMGDDEELSFSDRPDEEFIIGCVGRFRPRVAPLDPIIDILHSLKENYPNVYAHVHVRVWGCGSGGDQYDKYLRHVVRKTGVATRLEIVDGTSESELVKVLRECDALCLTQGNDELIQARLPTRFFMYLPVGRPILAVCDDESDLAKFMPRSGLGSAYNPERIDLVAAEIVRFVGLRDAKAKSGLHPNYNFLKQYSIQDGVIPLVDQLLSAVP